MIRDTAARVWNLAAACLLLSVVSWEASVSAQSDPRASRSPVGDAAVEITVVGRSADLQRIRSVIEPRHLGGSVPRWKRVARFDPMDLLRAIPDDTQIIIVRCWVDVSDPAHARLYFAARSGQQFLVRDVELSGNFDELDRESLSNVLELSITALLDSEKAGLTRAQAQAVLASREIIAAPPVVIRPTSEHQANLVSAPAIVNLRSPKASAPFQGSATAFYGALSPGGGLPIAHGPGVSLGLGRTRDHLAVEAWISGQYQWASRYQGPVVGVQLQTIAPRGGLEFRLPIGAYQVSARLGGGTDLVRISPQAGVVETNAALAPTRWSQDLVFSAAIGIRRVLGSRFLLGGAVLMDVVPTAVHYDVAVAGMTSAVVSPRRVRPGLILEFGVR